MDTAETKDFDKVSYESDDHKQVPAAFITDIE